MARKKKRIKVNLELPKNDTTMTKLYAILGVCILTGITCLGFWVTNSTFVPSPNGQPLFVNMACGWDPTLLPNYSMNESCGLLHDEPQETVYVPLEEWKGFSARGVKFTVPGLSQEQLGDFTGDRLQPLEVNCEVIADFNIPYTVRIVDNASDLQAPPHSSFVDKDDCHLDLDDAIPGQTYRLEVFSDDSEQEIKRFSFEISALVFDGIPENMNNGSMWIGPDVELGGSSFRPTLFLNFFALGLFILFYPASWYWDGVKNSINEVEEKFPDFLRDLAEYWKGGLAMTIAVETLANSEYGALNPEVKKMSDQLSWGIAFGDVIQMFADRVGTPLVKRAISLIHEANKAGGKISDILITAANDSREIKFLEAERARAIASYIAVIWVSYIVFLGVIVVLGKVFIPAIASSNAGEGEDDSGGAELGNMEIRAIDPLFFLTVFFYGVTLQAVGNGAMAGLMATGRLSSGLKHAGMMIVMALLAFNFIVFSPDLIGVEQVDSIKASVGTYIPSK